MRTQGNDKLQLIFRETQQFVPHLLLFANSLMNCLVVSWKKTIFADEIHFF